MKGSVHNAGNFKLRGKKCKLLRCGCCIVQNLKHEVTVADLNKQIREFKYNVSTD